MKKHLTLLLILFASVHIHCFGQPLFTWANRLAGTVNGIAVVTSGNVYTTGKFFGTLDFDPGTGTHNLTAQSEDIFIYKSDAAGNFVWAKNIGGMGPDQAYAIAVDDSENVYTTGVFSDTADFDPGPNVHNLENGPFGGNFFISKLNAAGNYVWAKSFSTANPPFGGVTLNSIKTDRSGNIFVTGSFSGSEDFDPGPGTFVLTSTALNGSDIFILKLDRAGNFLWAKSMEGTSNAQSHSLAIDKTGNVYTCGDFRGTVDFDPGTGTQNASASGFADIFILKLNVSGQFVWVKKIGASGSSNSAISIALDTSGHLATTGYFNGTVDFNPGTAVNNLTSATAGAVDVFALKLDTAGTFFWAKSMGGNSSDGGSSVALDDSANVYIEGTFMDSADLDPGTPVFKVRSAGGTDIFTAKLSAAGNFVWAYKIGGRSADFAAGITVDASRNIYITGQFSDTCDFDPWPPTFNLIAEGDYNSFVSKLGQRILPLGLLSFSAETITDKKVRLYWQTANEQNTAKFVVERSTDQKNFTSVGEVMAAGTSHTKKEYSFSDDLLPSVLAIYYRLKMMDRDGAFTYSAIRRLSNKTANTLLIYPNPAGSIVHVEAKNIASIKLIDNTGRNIETYFCSSSATTVLHLEHLPKGLYFVEVTNDAGKTERSKLMMQ